MSIDIDIKQSVESSVEMAVIAKQVCNCNYQGKLPEQSVRLNEFYNESDDLEKF